MSIQVKEETLPGDPGTEPAALAGGITPDLLAAIRSEVNDATTQATERAFKYADVVSRDLLTRMREELAGYAKPKAQILAVEVSGERRKLSRSAPSYLGHMILNAKLGISTLLVGPAGCGKTVAAELLAESLGLSFGQVCFSAGASETWLFGRQTPNGFVEGEFSRMYREGGVFLLDEIDAADANMLLALNTALANGVLFNPISGQSHKRHASFIVVAAANTGCLGGSMVYVGRNRLDGASIDRFFPIEVDYCEKIEEQICPDEALRLVYQNARLKLRELKSPQIMSTRRLGYAYALAQNGIAKEAIFGSLTMGWPEGLAAQVGLPVKKAKK